MNFDPQAIFEVLSSNEVDFVVIGGVAALIHGSPSVTQDLDICYSRDPKNLKRLAAALRALDARLRDVPDTVRFELDERSLAAGDHFTFTTSHGDFDCFGHPAGSEGFDDLTSSAPIIEVEGIRFAVASIDDLIRMKRASDRPKDRAEIEILGALREESYRSEGS